MNTYARNFKNLDHGRNIRKYSCRSANMRNMLDSITEEQELVDEQHRKTEKVTGNQKENKKKRKSLLALFVDFCFSNDTPFYE